MIKDTAKALAKVIGLAVGVEARIQHARRRAQVLHRLGDDVLTIGSCLLRKEDQDPKLKLDYKNAFELD